MIIPHSTIPKFWTIPDAPFWISIGSSPLHKHMVIIHDPTFIDACVFPTKKKTKTKTIIYYMVSKGHFWLPKGILNTWLYPIGIHDETWRPLPLFFWTHHVLFFSRSNGEICPYSRFCLRQFAFIFPGNLPTHGESIVVFFIFWAPDPQIQVHWGPVVMQWDLVAKFIFDDMGFVWR